MDRKVMSTPTYGNWISNKLLAICGLLTVISFLITLLQPWFVITTLLLLLCFSYFAYARWCFSPKGKNIQKKVQVHMLEYLDWDGNGEVLDIGCGSGFLCIQLAKSYPHAHITGVDYFRGTWQYSENISKENARIEGVSNRIAFQRASAEALPFEDNAFDMVMSNLTFHEVGTTKDKMLLIKEALRVLKKGGVFIFQDLFQWKQVFGDIEGLLNELRTIGIESVDFIDTSTLPCIPKALKLSFMVGTLGIIKGKK